MKFWCKGKKWDTDRQLFVAGYDLEGDWSNLKPGSSFSQSCLVSYGLRCKKAYIQTLHIKHEDGQSYVDDFDVYIPAERGFCRQALTYSVVGLSIKDIKKQLSI